MGTPKLPMPTTSTLARDGEGLLHLIQRRLMLTIFISAMRMRKDGGEEKLPPTQKLPMPTTSTWAKDGALVHLTVLPQTRTTSTSANDCMDMVAKTVSNPSNIMLSRGMRDLANFHNLKRRFYT